MLASAWNILCESAIFILVGFVIAGILQAVLSSERMLRPLRTRHPRSVFLATLIGMPLPLCSCSVLPTAVALRRKGASPGATMSFLISTPETSVTSVLLTYALLGPVMAVFRPVAACITAVAAGLTGNLIDRADRTRPGAAAGTPGPGGPPGGPPEVNAADVGARDIIGPGRGSGTRIAITQATPPLRERIRSGLRYAFVDIFDDIAGWIVIGILAAAAIQVWVPAETLARILGGSLQSMIILVLIGVPLYVCAEASTPIAAALILQGVSPGAALVFLLVGPATNIGALGVLTQQLGRRLVIAYLAAIIVVAMLMGALLDAGLGSAGLTLSDRAIDEPLVPPVVKVMAALVFLVMTGVTARRRRWIPRLTAALDRRLPIRVDVRRTTLGLIVLAVLIWIGSGCFTVLPGEVAMVRRFGALHGSERGPGLHITLPPPIDRVDRIPMRTVRRLVMGARSTPDGRWITDPAESQFTVGDENIADLQMTVHWGAAEGKAIEFRYGVLDPEELVRSTTLATAREVVGGEPIADLFTGDRRTCEERIRDLTQARLEAYGAGIRIHAFHFLDAHAPPEVHAAFRDVASALEDRDTRIDLARAEEARIIPAARGEAAQSAAEADGYRAMTVRRSRGEADGFRALEGVHREYPRVTRQRLTFETLEKVLPGMRKYIKPPEADGGRLEIWFVEPDALDKLPQLPGRESR